MFESISKIFNIYNVISELSKTNPIFHNEQGFQDYLVHKIGQCYPKLKIKFEHKTILNKGHKSYIDILIKDENGLCIPIELKYRTNKLCYNFDDCLYDLSNQSAEDVTRYGYLKDISRLEKYSEIEEKFLVGYAIMLTNQCNVWKENYYNIENTFKNFLINDNTLVLSGIKKWSDNTSNSIKHSYPPFELKNSYQIKWLNYSDFKCKNGNFRIVITEIKKAKTKNNVISKQPQQKEMLKSQESKKKTYTNVRDYNSQIINEIEQYLSNIPINSILKTGEFRTILSNIHGRSKDCYIPTDYCYNRFNNGINFETQPKFFIYIKRGQVKFVGKHYIYTGPVLHKLKRSKLETEIGYCHNGRYKFY